MTKEIYVAALGHRTMVWQALCGEPKPGSSFSQNHLNQFGGVDAILAMHGGTIEVCEECRTIYARISQS